MPIIWNVEPGVMIPFSQFCVVKPRRSIALDGYCPDPPMFNPETVSRNFDHHHGVSRDDTLCTAMQVAGAIRRDLFETFCNEFGPDAQVFLNDIDPDAAMSAIMLRNHRLVASVANPILNRNLEVLHNLDSAGGLWPYPLDMEALLEQNWMFSDYWRMRMSGELDQKDATTYLQALESMEVKFRELMAGHGKRFPLSGDYERIGGGHGWIMVREKGPQARLRMAKEGVRALVSVRNAPEGRYFYSILRYSVYTPFPIPRIMAALNAQEEADTQFGGSDTIIANARGRGSLRPPKDIEALINELLLPPSS